MKKELFIFISFVIFQVTLAKTGINTQTLSDATVLDIQSTDKGILLPRVQLQVGNSFQPLAAISHNVTLVFNTAVAGTGSNKIFQGPVLLLISIYLLHQVLQFKG